jgi:type IV pilus assembly protein PilV
MLMDTSIGSRVMTCRGMIEIMITILVMAIGLLGIAILQTRGHQFVHSSYQRTLAVHKAHEMVDRMRANRLGVGQGYYDAVEGIPSSHTDCRSVACTAEQMAQFDQYEWNTHLQEILPSGQGKVTGNGLESVFTIQVMWDELRNDATGTGCNPDDPDDLACIQITARL